MIIGSHQVNIRDAYGRKIAMVLANEISGRSAAPNGKIIFHCYSEQCFLSEVWSPPTKTDVSCSRLDRRETWRKRKTENTSQFSERNLRSSHAGDATAPERENLELAEPLEPKKPANARRPNATTVPSTLPS